MKPKRTNDPEALRRRVLDVAAAAFQAAGYHSTSTHEIMRRAGVTGGAFHHHFPTKKSVALAVIEERVAPAVRRTWIEPIKAASNTLDGILDTFEAIALSVEKRGKVLGCPLGNIAIELSLADPDFQKAVRAIFVEWRAAIADKVRADNPKGRKGPTSTNPDDLAALVVASYSGAMAMAKAEQTSDPLRRCSRQIASLLAR
jgi:TetR/AcrR family transcriptional regulator, transcriptional repressor for nem operon